MKKKIKKSFTGYMDIEQLKKLDWEEGTLRIPYLYRTLPYDNEKHIRITIEQLK